MKKIQKKTFRTIIILFIVTTQIFFIHQYWLNRDLIHNQKYSYFRYIYSSIFFSTLKNLPHAFRVSPSPQSKQTQAIPVILYHSILEKPDGANVTVPNFVDQMKALHDAGYKTISLKEFYEFFNGKKQLDEKSILITFDDGPKMSYYPVDPLLSFYNFKAVSFIITHFSIGSGSSFYLSSKEIKRMLASGRWEIQLHTDIGHTLYQINEAGDKGRFYPNKLWIKQKNRIETNDEYIERITSELKQADQKLEKEFSVDNYSFAYPFGDYGQNQTNYPEGKTTLETVVSTIFPTAFYQIYRGGGYTFNYQHDQSFMKKRIIVQPEWNGKDLIQTLEKGTPKSLPYSDSFTENKGWTNTWGKQVIENSGFKLTTDNTQGGSVFLDGTYHWENYTFSTDIEWKKGSSISLLSRYKDNDTFVLCNINEESIIIEENIDGETKELTRKFNRRELTDGKKLTLEMDVKENTVTCKENGKTIVQTALLNPLLNTGGIGFKNWNDSVDKSEVIVRNIRVQSL